MAQILLAEDDDSVRSFVKRALEIDGHAITAVEDGATALEVLERRSGGFDLLLSDVKMPVMDGIALALNAARDYPTLPILLMTGYADQRERAHGLDELVRDVILKPFSLADIRRAVAIALTGPAVDKLAGFARIAGAAGPPGAGLRPIEIVPVPSPAPQRPVFACRRGRRTIAARLPCTPHPAASDRIAAMRRITENRPRDGEPWGWVMQMVVRPQSARRQLVKAAMEAPFLTRDEEYELAVKWRAAGDEAALHRLTAAHMRLVFALASRFRHFGLSPGDLVQEGHIGLLEAAARFEPERNVRFSTY
eukprot:gene31007-35313_t